MDQTLARGSEAAVVWCVKLRVARVRFALGRTMEAVAAIKSFVVEYASVLSSVVTITGKEQILHCIAYVYSQCSSNPAYFV